MTKNRHELPRKNPARNAKDEIAEDLPVLEPIADELPTLEPIAEELPTLAPVEAEPPAPEPTGPVRVARSPSEGDFDLVLTVEVAEMDKKSVAAALQAPFARACAQYAAAIRNRKVLVRFDGETLIGSAARDLVAETIKPHKPLLAIVRRGMGDETVTHGKPPEVAVAASEHDGVTKLEVATGELEAADLPVALAPHVAALAPLAKGRRYRFVFTGKARPDAALRGELAAALQAAGARAARVGERVLFDKDLTDRVRATVSGQTVVIAVQCADDEDTTIEALTLALPQHASAWPGKVVRFDLSRSIPAACAVCLEFAQKQGAARVDFGDVVVWPKLIAAQAGAEVALRLQANGRTPDQTLAALVAEAPAHAAACQGRPVLIDWPAGFALDADAGKALCEVVGALQPRTLACSFGGEQREPFVPDPCAFAQDGATTVLTLDSEAGKAAELQRAIDRRLPGRAKELRGKPVRVQVAGNAVVSRTLLRGVFGVLQQAGVSRLEMVEAAGFDVLTPPLLAIDHRPDAVRIAANLAGRDAAQQGKALAREIDAAGIHAGEVVVVAPSALVDAITAAVVDKGASKVLVDGDAPVQVHPPLLGALDKKGLFVRLVVTAGGDEAMVARQLDRELPAVAADLPALQGNTVTIVWAGGDSRSANVARLVETFVQNEAAKVVFDGGDGVELVLHPAQRRKASPPDELPTLPLADAAPAAAPTPSVAEAAPVAQPSPAAAAGPVALRLLARRDDAAPPLVVVGVPAGVDAAHVAAVEAELQRHLPRFAGRAVLLVLRAGDRDVPVRRLDPLVAMMRRTVPMAAAATLVFRGPDGEGRPHFEALHSRVPALPAGATFADPRVRP
ncbi:MAG: hypothetical protein ACK6D1_03060 [Planctomycetota bacterium]